METHAVCESVATRKVDIDSVFPSEASEAMISAAANVTLLVALAVLVLVCPAYGERCRLSYASCLYAPSCHRSCARARVCVFSPLNLNPMRPSPPAIGAALTCTNNALDGEGGVCSCASGCASCSFDTDSGPLECLRCLKTFVSVPPRYMFTTLSHLSPFTPFQPTAPPAIACPQPPPLP